MQIITKMSIKALINCFYINLSKFIIHFVAALLRGSKKVLYVILAKGGNPEKTLKIGKTI